jgi:cytidyltransferase-like protein
MFSPQESMRTEFKVKSIKVRAESIALNQQLIENIHQAEGLFSLAVTGAGSQAIADLFSVAGASRTLLEAQVPYHDQALRTFLQARTPQGCHSGTARAMAMVAYQRARAMESSIAVFGVGCTAAIATDRTRRGKDRCHLALQSRDRTRSLDVIFLRALDRYQQERICSDLIIALMAEALDIQALTIPESDDFECTEKLLIAQDEWQSLLAGESSATIDAPVRAVFPGAFNPLHAGHRTMIEFAQHQLDTDITLEISIRNVDKPPLDYLSMYERQMAAEDFPIVFTNAPTFLDKSALFPHTVFIVGADTLSRIDDPVYYADETARDEAIQTLVDRGITFLVFGRQMPAGFLTLEDLTLTPALAAVCTGVTEAAFREDISSTELREETRAQT